ncbi:HAD family hydrolase [Bradyrhizobium sp. STM 3562]|uniref:HAD family hydrolase n=1 Tax=Bradyrhizobium sp. STM 3562 TaxID=578924 RepID=UPI00388F7CFF
MSRHYDAVLFDLLTALLDSWSLWNAVPGSEAAGRSWRAEYLRMTYGTGPYRPYEDIVREAADRVGLPSGRADALAARYSELKPWPGVTGVLTKLREAGVPLGVVTNCSEKLGRIAVGRIGVPFEVVVTAERAGFYKPDPHPYNLALEELGVAPERSLFVAGSPYDLFGTARVGLPAFWHDRMGAELEGAPTPIARHRDLMPLIAVVLG